MSKPTYYKEKTLLSDSCKYIAGVDEAGAGSLIGPVVAAAVILSEDKLDDRINDSKQLTAKERDVLYDIIINNAVSWAIGINSVERIDEINILWARLEAMKKAIEVLSPKPSHILVDGDRKIPNIEIDQTVIIKGDTTSISIAAASIVAKVTRDRMLIKMAKAYPKYNLDSNKGYYCKKTIEQINKDGYIKGLHRKKFVEKFTKINQ